MSLPLNCERALALSRVLRLPCFDDAVGAAWKRRKSPDGKEVGVHHHQKRARSIRVELLDASSTPRPGFTLAGVNKLVGDEIAPEPARHSLS